MLLIGFGVLDLELTVLSTVATLPVVAGLILGEKLRSRVSDERFSRMVLVVLLVSGATMLWRALI
jgi:uncharacterized membrane protein YfcA